MIILGPKAHYCSLWPTLFQIHPEARLFARSQVSILFTDALHHVSQVGLPVLGQARWLPRRMMVIMMAHLLDLLGSLLVVLHLILLLLTGMEVVMALSAFIAFGYLCTAGFMNGGTMMNLGRRRLVGRRVQHYDTLL